MCRPLTKFHKNLSYSNTYIPKIAAATKTELEFDVCCYLSRTLPCGMMRAKKRTEEVIYDYIRLSFFGYFFTETIYRYSCIFDFSTYYLSYWKEFWQYLFDIYLYGTIYIFLNQHIFKSQEKVEMKHEFHTHII